MRIYARQTDSKGQLLYRTYREYERIITWLPERPFESPPSFRSRETNYDWTCQLWNRRRRRWVGGRRLRRGARLPLANVCAVLKRTDSCSARYLGP